MKDFALPIIAAALILLWITCFWTIQRSLSIGLPANFETLSFLFSTIGALITGVSIVELGIKESESGGGFRIGLSTSVLSTGITQFQKLFSALMLIAWLLVGIWSVVIWIFHVPPSDPAGKGGNEALLLIQNHAKAWIGFAIAALYAYLGVRPKS
jgi:hypothetical protein